MALKRKGLLLGVAMATVLIAVLLVRLDWAEFREAIADVRWSWIAAGCAGILVGMSIRAARWLVLSSERPSVFPAYWNATVAGYVGNVLYPGRAGDVLRVAALHQAIRVPPGEAVASAFMDRLTDVVMLSAVTLYVLAYVARESLESGVVAYVLAMATVFVVAFAAMVTLGARVHPLVVRASARLPGHWSERVPRWYAQAVTACRALASPRRLTLPLLLTALAFFVDYGVFWLILRAFEWQLPMQAAITLGVFLAIGSLLPAAPGYVGIYQVACVLALKWYGISESAALAYSVVAQGATLLVIFAAGGAVALRYGLHWGAANRPGA